MNDGVQARAFAKAVTGPAVHKAGFSIEVY